MKISGDVKTERERERDNIYVNTYRFKEMHISK